MSAKSFHKRNELLLKTLKIDENLYDNIEEIVENCKKLIHLTIGHKNYPYHDGGEIWTSEGLSINCSLSTQHTNQPHQQVDQNNLSSSEDEDQFELDIKLIAKKLHELKSLNIGSGVQLKRQPVAPAMLDELINLEELRLCPIKIGVRCDRSRDEWNLRTLAQSSTELNKLDLRGCYLKIFSLGWLKTEKLEALHLYYQVPAASILFKWSKTLKYLTLAKVSSKYRTYRSMGPDEPGQELDACLYMLASDDRSQLLQLDLQESDYSLDALKLVIEKCNMLSYLDTTQSEKLPQNLRVRCESRSKILNLFCSPA